MKAVGAALAISSQMLTCFLCIVAIALCYKASRSKLKRFSRASFRETCPIARKGFPGFLMYFLDLISLEAVVFVSSFLSTEHLAANSALVNFFYAVIVFGFGLQGSAGPLIGRAMGEGTLPRRK